MAHGFLKNKTKKQSFCFLLPLIITPSALCSPHLHVLFFSLFVLPSSPRPAPHRSSRWFPGAASPQSRAGSTGRRRRGAPTAPRREPSTRSSTCRSRSAPCQVSAATATVAGYSINSSCRKVFTFCTEVKREISMEKILW